MKIYFYYVIFCILLRNIDAFLLYMLSMKSCLHEKNIFENTI